MNQKLKGNYFDRRHAKRKKQCAEENTNEKQCAESRTPPTVGITTTAVHENPILKKKRRPPLKHPDKQEKLSKIKRKYSNFWRFQVTTGDSRYLSNALDVYRGCYQFTRRNTEREGGRWSLQQCERLLDIPINLNCSCHADS